MNKLLKSALIPNERSDLGAQSQSQGFTLVELLLVIALISISVGVTGDILVTLTRSYNKTAVLTEIEQQANFIGLKLEKDLRNATNVATASGGTEISFDLNGTLVCYRVISSGSYTNIYRATGSCPVANSTNALLATPSITGTSIGLNMACTGTCFTVTGSNPQIADISMTFSQATGGGSSFSGNVVLKNTIVIRNSY
jgi:prepilin-type N-terminal cleavage/methylation domain-containing protein